jgi:hypothetical protein
VTSPVNSRRLIVKEAAGADHLPRCVSTSNERRGRMSQEPSQPKAIIQLQPLALPPLAAAQLLSISKRSLSRLIFAGKIIARKEGSRTLVDVESLKAYYAGLPVKR